MKFAVLGATGTVGRALVPLLAERDEVVAISRRASPTTNGVRSVAADVTDGERSVVPRGRGRRVLPRPLARHGRLPRA